MDLPPAVRTISLCGVKMLVEPEVPGDEREMCQECAVMDAARRLGGFEVVVCAYCKGRGSVVWHAGNPAAMQCPVCRGRGTMRHFRGGSR